MWKMLPVLPNVLKNLEGKCDIMRCLAPSFTMQNVDRLGVLEEKHVLQHEVNVYDIDK